MVNKNGFKLKKFARLAAHTQKHKILLSVSGRKLELCFIKFFSFMVLLSANEVVFE